MATYAYQPDKDAGWGLIFRLNALWEKADIRALSGNYNGWELVLDRIFANLLYRNEIETIEDKDGKLIDIRIMEDDIKEWEIMKRNIRDAKINKTKALRKGQLSLSTQSNENYYKSILFYDFWLRKFMQKHQLYLKEIEHNPSKALFGGAFQKK